jgi:hypothetical protein
MPFDPSQDLVHYAGRVFDAEELCNLVDASLDFFLAAFADGIERMVVDLAPGQDRDFFIQEMDQAADHAALYKPHMRKMAANHNLDFQS